MYVFSSAVSFSSIRTFVGSLSLIRYSLSDNLSPITSPAVVSTLWVSPARPFSNPYLHMHLAPFPHISPMDPSELKKSIRKSPVPSALSTAIKPSPSAMIKAPPMPSKRQNHSRGNLWPYPPQTEENALLTFLPRICFQCP